MLDPKIDCLQYAQWSEKIFLELRVGKVDAIHVTIAYHENFHEAIQNLEQWNKRFEEFDHLIFQHL